MVAFTEHALYPATLIALGWAVFAATHIGLAVRPVRHRLVERLGRFGFTRLFSLVAFVSFGGLLHLFALHHGQGAGFAGLADFAPARWAGCLLMGLGVMLSIAAFQNPPASALPLSIRRQLAAPAGLERITRHPLFVGAALLGLGHLLLARDLVTVVAFGGLAIYALAGAMHQDRKLRTELGAEYAAYLQATSLWPFVAIATGRQTLALRELPWAGLLLGAAAAALLAWRHDGILAAGGAYAIAAMVLGPVIAGLLVLRARNRARRVGSAGVTTGG